MIFFTKEVPQTLPQRIWMKMHPRCVPSICQIVAASKETSVISVTLWLPTEPSLTEYVSIFSHLGGVSKPNDVISFTAELPEILPQLEVMDLQGLLPVVIFSVLLCAPKLMPTN